MSETLSPVQAEGEKKADTGIITHGYWLSEKGERTDLSLRSALNLRAGVVEYRARKEAGQNPQLFVDLDHMWGPDEPTEGSLLGKRAVEHYGVPAEDVVVREDAWSTGGEVGAFVEEAKNRGWKNLVDVAFASHHLTIPGIFKKIGLKPEYKSAEDILREKDQHKIERKYKVRRVLDLDKEGNFAPWRSVPIAERQYEETGEERTFVHLDNHTARLINRLSSSNPFKSPFGFIYRFIYEPTKWGLMHKPGFDYQTLEQKQRDSRKTKGPDSPLSKLLGRKLDFDVYTLNGKKSPFANRAKNK